MAAARPVDPIKAIGTDVGHVLIRFDRNALRDSVKEGLRISEGDFDWVWQTLVGRWLGVGRISEQHMWQLVAEQTGARQVSIEENLLGKSFAQTVKPDKLVYATYKSLREQGLKIGILSNSIEPHSRFLRGEGYYDGFDAVLLSQEIGMRKPGRAAFLRLARELGVNPNEMLFVDDDAVNVRVADELSMTGIYFTSAEQLLDELRLQLPGFQV